MAEERQIDGTLKRWGNEVQQISPTFYKLGLQLEEEGLKDWHNLTGTSKAELESLKANFPVGGKVTFKEWKNEKDDKVYWNFVKDSFGGEHAELEGQATIPMTNVDDLAEESPKNDVLEGINNQLENIVNMLQNIEQKLEESG